MNSIVRNLAVQSFQNFKSSLEEKRKEVVISKEGKPVVKNSKDFIYNEDGKLVHPWAGPNTYATEMFKRFLRVVVPERFGISSGCVITSKGSASAPCDFIIYDKMMTPKFEDKINKRFFPVETVSCLGVIKFEVISIETLNKFLIKLSEIKKLRDEVKYPCKYYPQPDKQYLPDRDATDHIFSFLICNKFDFAFDISKIDYKGVEQRLKHNVVLSVEDGLLNYTNSPTSNNVNYPFKRTGNFQDILQPISNDELPNHIIHFLSSIQFALFNNSLLKIDMAQYLSNSDNFNTHE
jgi:hypothetical protein